MDESLYFVHTRNWSKEIFNIYKKPKPYLKDRTGKKDHIDHNRKIIYKKPIPYLKSSLHSCQRETEIYNGFSHFYRKKTN